MSDVFYCLPGLDYSLDGVAKERMMEREICVYGFKEMTLDPLSLGYSFGTRCSTCNTTIGGGFG